MRKNFSIPKKYLTRRMFFWPDTHAPFQDKRAVRTALAAVKAFKPNVFVFGGDIVDLYSLSNHANKVPGLTTFDKEMAALHKLISQVEAALPKGCEKIYLMGNHEWRHDRYYMNSAPEMYGSQSIAGLLDLDARGWQTVPYDSGEEGVWLGKLWACHDVGPAGVQAARQSLLVQGGSIIFGHAHRLQSYYESTARGQQHVAVCSGWLGDANHRAFNFMPKSKRRGWQHGFTVGYIFDDGNFQLMPTPIVKGTCIIEGQVVKG